MTPPPAGPRLDPDSPTPWLLSGSGKQDHVIASSGRRAVLLRGASARAAATDARAYRATLAASGRERRTAVVWPADPVLASDRVIAPDQPVWHDAASLSRLLGRPAPHVYAVCFERVATFFDSLASAAVAAPLTPLLVYGDEMIVGPTLLPDASPCPACWAARVLDASRALAARVTAGHSLLDAPRWRPSDLVALARVLWERPEPDEPAGRGLFLDLRSGEVRFRTLVTSGDCDCGAPSGPPPGIDEMVGRPFGLVAHAGALASAPAPFTVWTAAAAEDLGGAAGLDADRTRQRAVFEVIERRSARRPGALAVRGCATDLSGAVETARLLPFTDEQYATPGFPYVAVDDHTGLTWAEGDDLAGRTRALVPLDLVALGPARDLRFAPRSSTGIAAGASLAEATERAVLEVVERDVVTRGWADGDWARLRPSELAPREHRAATVAGARVRAARAEGVAAPVVVVELTTGEGEQAWGCAAGPGIAAACRHAIEEAVLMLTHARSTDRPAAPVEWRWDDCAEADPRELAAPAWDALLDHYRPVAVELTNRDAAAADLAVVGVWSPVAVDFPVPAEPMPLRRWQPTLAGTPLLTGDAFPFGAA